MQNIHCRECTKRISDTAISCPFCGARQRGRCIEAIQLNWTVTLVISILFGWLGIDRFMMGQIGLGILKLITGGGFGIWWVIDIILIATKKVPNIEWE